VAGRDHRSEMRSRSRAIPLLSSET